MSEAKQASNEDLRRAALDHYEQLSKASCSWMNTIPKAINAYFDQRSRSEQAGQRGQGTQECDSVVPASPAGPSAVEELAAQLHDIYQAEAHRQGDVRHADEYASLSDDIKEFDRVMARFILAREQCHAKELDRLRRLAPLCDKCSSGHGTRSGCPYCSMKKLYTALSQIDYACGEPNEMRVSGFDVHCDENAVVTRVKTTLDRLRARLREAEGLLRRALSELDECVDVEVPDIERFLNDH